MPGVRIREITDEIADCHGGIDIAVDALHDIGLQSPLLKPFASLLIEDLEKIKARLGKWKEALEI